MIEQPGAVDIVRIGVVAAVVAITQIALTISFASLVFRDELAGDLRLGLAAMFAGMAISTAWMAARSGFGGHVVSPQDSGLIVLSVVASSITAAAGAAAGPTMIVLMGIGSAGVGLLLVLLGRFHLGRLVRYLPFPVLAGFMVGTGLVMARGTIELVWRGLAGDASGGDDRVGRVAVAFAVTAAMVAISRSSRSTEKLMPTLVIGSVIAVQVWRFAVGIGRSDGAERGWLLPVLPDGSLLSRDWMSSGANADWGVVVEQLPALIPLLILAPLTLLLYLGALEALLDIEIDADREFRAIGVANLLAGAAGSSVSYTQFANTMLVQRMAGPRRVVPVVIAAGAVAVLFTGDLVVSLVPQPVVAGMLGFIAASFVLDWSWDVRRRLSRVEMLLALAIAASIPTFGFLAGVGLGLLLSTGWFVVQYSRISGVRRVGDAEVRRSNVARGPDADEVLRATGDQVAVLELDGYLFFGTGDSVARSIAERVDADASRLRWVILDLTRVTGADSSAAASFQQLARRLDRRGVEIVWCGLRGPVGRSLGLSGDSATVYPDLDRALERTEAVRLAAGARAASTDAAESLPTAWSDELLEVVGRAGERRHFVADDEVLRRGEAGRGLMVIESGRVSVLDGTARLRSFGPGAVLGEIGLYGQRSASATVVADVDTTVVEIDRSAIDRLEESDPAAATRLHKALAATLAERLVVANDVLDDFRAADRAGG